MKQKPSIAVLLDDGFEIAEAMICIDMLRRTLIDVDVISCSNNKQLLSYFNIPIQTDSTLEERIENTYDAVLLPGGPKGTDNLTANPQVIKFVQRHLAAGSYICALCSAGAKVLAGHNLLGEHKYTSSLNLTDKFTDGRYCEDDVVIDGQFITGRGLGVSFEFALTIAQTLHKDSDQKEKDEVDYQADHIFFKHWATFNK
ncbi:MAG: DJ-1/PfpI family protein [Vibrio sp.]